MAGSQGIAKLEGEMQAVRALLGNSSNIMAALREVATPSGAARLALTSYKDLNVIAKCLLILLFTENAW